MRVLGLETSCDETAAAIVTAEGRVLANAIATQIPVHERYGGVVPELASRNHVMAVLPVIEAALARAGCSMADIDAIAVTRGPGLIGSILIGLQTAKALAWLFDRPLVPVDHIVAHITAVTLEPPEGATDAGRTEPPFVALVASGGHTALYDVAAIGEHSVIGHTLDDAAGECFDKVAKLLGLPYPGGVSIDRRSEHGDPDAIAFPRAMMRPGNANFSFSGLKTAVRNHVAKAHPEGVSGRDLDNIAASVQEAIVDALVEKSIGALRHSGRRRLVLAGGVAANRRLRVKAAQRCAREGFDLVLTAKAYCTDNAAMVAGLGARLLAEHGAEAYAARDIDAYANLRVGSPRAAKAKRYAS